MTSRGGDESGPGRLAVGSARRGDRPAAGSLRICLKEGSSGRRCGGRGSHGGLRPRLGLRTAGDGERSRVVRVISPTRPRDQGDEGQHPHDQADLHRVLLSRAAVPAAHLTPAAAGRFPNDSPAQRPMKRGSPLLAERQRPLLGIGGITHERRDPSLVVDVSVELEED